MRKKLNSNKLIFSAGIILLFYGLIEISDCVSTLLMSFGLIENPYPVFAFDPLETTINQYPISVFGIFLFYTVLRIAAGVGLVRNRMWGFWLAIFITTVTSVNMFLALPLSGADAIFSIFVISFLLIGYFGKAEIGKMSV